MARMFQARAKVDVNSKIKKGFVITGETPWSKPDGRDIHRALEQQYGKDAAAFSDSLSKWEILS